MIREKSIEQKIHEAILSDDYMQLMREHVNKLSALATTEVVVQIEDGQMVGLEIKEPFKTALEQANMLMELRIEQIKRVNQPTPNP